MVKRRILKKVKKKNPRTKRNLKHKKYITITDDYLNSNLEKLYKSLEPTPNNQLKKKETFLIIKNLIIENIKYIEEIYLYGSFFQNIDLQNSDIDVTVVCEEDSLKRNNTTSYIVLKEICLILNQHNFSSKYIYALVPIVQGTCITTGVGFDISFGHKEGYTIGLLIKNKISAIPILRPIILIMKFILIINNLNKPYTGGMNSFVLFHLVYAYYRLIKDEVDDGDMSLKLFLMKFLNFYGNVFNERTFSILNDKTEACLINKKLFNSSFEDKIDIQCFKKAPNAAVKCFNYGKIKKMFQYAYEKLCELEEKNEKDVDLISLCSTFYETYHSNQRKHYYAPSYSDFNMCYMHDSFDYGFNY